MRSAFSPFAIAARLLPAARSRLIRSIAYWPRRVQRETGAHSPFCLTPIE
jgi:hypothetical protein